MASLEAQRLLERVILDYMLKRGFHQTGEVFFREICAKQNPDEIISPDEAFLQAWWGKFYEAYSSRFPGIPVLAAESFDKVAQTLENAVANNCPANQSYASDHTVVNISNVIPWMASPVMESSGPDLMDDARISDLMSRDMPSILPSLDMNEMDGMLPFASNAGYQMPTVPPEWNERGHRHDINLGRPTRMEPNIHAPANALPASPDISDAGNNRSLQLASQQGWPSVPSNLFRNLVKHAGQVMSIDFHPTKMALLSSCASNDEIRLWDVNRGDCKLILKVAQTMENIAPNINPEKSTYAPNHRGANISSVMAPDGNTGSLLGQGPSAPAVTASAPGINLGGPTLTEPNIHAPANALPASPELGRLHLLIPKLMGESDAVTK